MRIPTNMCCNLKAISAFGGHSFAFVGRRCLLDLIYDTLSRLCSSPHVYYSSLVGTDLFQPSPSSYTLVNVQQPQRCSHCWLFIRYMIPLDCILACFHTLASASHNTAAWSGCGPRGLNKLLTLEYVQRLTSDLVGENDE